MPVLRPLPANYFRRPSSRHRRQATFNLLLVLVVCGLQLLFSLSSSAAAYDVTAKVSAAIPSAPAAILSPSDNITVHGPLILLSGTCQVLSPPVIVSIWRSDTFLGSAVCDSIGSFSLLVTLPSGSNSLIVKSENITYDFGPDSQPFSINYIPVIQVPTSSTPSITPSLLEPKTLQIETESEFVAFQLNVETTISFNIKDGEAPYTLAVDWGDGTSDTYNYDSPGRKTITHTFSTLSRSIKLVITDKNNKTVELVLGAVTSASDGPLAKNHSQNIFSSSTARVAAVTTLTAVAAAGAMWPKMNLHHVKSQRPTKRPRKNPVRGKK